MLDSIRWELGLRRWTIFWWSLGSVFLIVMIMALFPTIRDQAPQFNQVMNDMPSSVRGVKTGNTQPVNVADPATFLNSQLFYITLPMIWIILAITRASSVLGRDEQNRTIELSLSRPLSREKLLTSKALSLALELLIVGIVSLAFMVILAPVFSLHIANAYLLLTTIYTVLFCLSFGLISFALQAVGRLTRRASSAIAVAISFGGYIIVTLGDMTTWLDVPVKLAPYHYFETDKLLAGQPAKGLSIYLLVVMASSLIVAYAGFRRRDLI